jgi:hypothetical protein
MAELPFSWILDDLPFFWEGADRGYFLLMSRPKDARDDWIPEFDSIHESLCIYLNHPRCMGRPVLRSSRREEKV